MKNNDLPVTVVWPSVVLFSTPCRTTSGLISTDAPQSSTPAFNEEGTRTHTAPTYDRTMRDKQRKGMTVQYSGRKTVVDKVNILLIRCVYRPDCGARHCHRPPHRHQCLRCERTPSGNYSNHLQKQSKPQVVCFYEPLIDTIRSSLCNQRVGLLTNNCIPRHILHRGVTF